MRDFRYETPKQIEKRAYAAGLTIAELCKRAKINNSTFTRFKNKETMPRLRTHQRLMCALERAEKRIKDKE